MSERFITAEAPQQLMWQLGDADDTLDSGMNTSLVVVDGVYVNRCDWTFPIWRLQVC